MHTGVPAVACARCGVALGALGPSPAGLHQEVLQRRASWLSWEGCMAISQRRLRERARVSLDGYEQGVGMARRSRGCRARGDPAEGLLVGVLWAVGTL